ncbi:MAG: protein kinase [bacterium]|nr:protein kinase [bacterium]
MTTCNHCGYESEDEFQFCPKCGTQHVQVEASGPIGTTLNDKYRILSELGAGSMGTVYLAEHISLKKKVAIKILHRDLQVNEEVLKRFQREGIAAGQVNHPNAIQIFDFDQNEEGKFFLAMEYVEGRDLKTVLASEKALEPSDAMRLTRQLLGTLTEAHAHGIVHRDLKPENLMVTRSTTGELSLKVLDFGLSKLVDRPLEASLQTQTGRVMGTPLYMAPEQWQGEDADTRTDLYSSALILFEMLAGKQPFKGKNLTETLVRSTTEPPPSLFETAPDVDLPDDIDAILTKALAKERDERFQSAQDMLEALDEVDVEETARPPQRRAASRRATKRPARRGAGGEESAGSKKPLVFGAVGVAALAILGFVMFGGGNGEGGTDGAVPLVRAKAKDSRSADEAEYVRLLEAAESAIGRGDPELAMRTMSDAMRLECADAEGFLIRAEASRLRGDPDTAVADLEEALQRYPGYALAEARIGWIRFDGRNLAAASKRFEQALARNQNCADARAGQGAIKLAKNDLEGARGILEAAAKTHADSPRVQYYFGRCLLAAGETAAAIAAFVDSKRLDGTFWPALVGLGDAYLQQNDLAAAERQYRDAVQAAPTKEPRPRARLAELLISRDQLQEAARLVTDLATTDLEKGTLDMLRGLVAAGQSEIGSAIELLGSALRESPTQPARIHELLGALHLSQSSWQLAADQCAAACELDENRGVAFRNWGMAMFQLGNYEQAAVRFDRAAAIDEDDVTAHLNAGIVYMDYLNRPEQALDHFRAFKRAGGRDSRVETWIERLKQ